MSLLGNIVWFIFGGFFSCIAYLVSGVGLFLTIIGIPFAFQTWKLGFAMLAPFGKDVVPTSTSPSLLRTIFNIIWIVFFGWEIALGHLLWALLLAITIIGLPFAAQHVKLVPLALFPFGHDLR